jgi:hypothetical protein
MITRANILNAIEKHDVLIAKMQKVLDSDPVAVAAGVSWSIDKIKIIESSTKAKENLIAMIDEVPA